MDESLQPGIIVIGTTGPLHLLSDTERASWYQSYRAVAAKWHPGQAPGLDARGFAEKLGGWASVKIGGIPGVLPRRVRVMVPKDHMSDTRFASFAGSLVGTTGDLVAARSDRDGLVWLERVLCPDDDSYRTCAHAYQHGIYDATTGQELDKHQKPKRNGLQIDIGTYVALPTKETRHKANELSQSDEHITSFESPRSMVEVAAGHP